MNVRLNEQQLAAVEAPADVPLMVVASPGSGKTAVLIRRVAHLIAECDAVPGQIVVTTFTRRAAEEMKERLEPLIESSVQSLRLGTIHSICLRILREEKLAKEVIQTYDQKKIIQEQLGYKNLDWDVGWRYPFNWLMKAKAALVMPDNAEEWFLQKLLDIGSRRWQARDIAQKVARVYEVYEREKMYLSRMDFLDMLVWVSQRLTGDGDFLSRWQRKIQFVLVDECQDTSGLSYDILRTLAAPEDRFFAVGDPDQELFRWNGADPDNNIFGFRSKFSESMILPLEINYRSTQVIVQAANEVIKANYEKASLERLEFKKVMVPRPDAPVGKDIVVLEFADQQEEAQGVRELIEMMLEEERQPKDVFVVYRVNSQSRAIEDALIRAGIPYVVQGSLGFYDRKVIKDVLAYLSLVDDERNDEAFQRVCNMASAEFFRPTRGFGARWMQECLSLAGGTKISLWEAMLMMKPHQQRYQKGGIQDFEDLLSSIRARAESSPVKAIRMIRADCYDQYLLRTEGLDAEMAQEEGVFDDLDELVFAAAQFETIEEFLRYVEEVREMQADRSKEKVDAVVLSTIHRVKGLERPVVIGIGMSEEILPHRFALAGGGIDAASSLPMESLSGLEDERCAVFVLVSRAQEELYLSWIGSYRNRPMQPSRFLFEMGLIEQEIEEEQTEQLMSSETPFRLAQGASGG